MTQWAQERAQALCNPCFLTRDLASVRDKGKLAVNVVDTQQVKDLWQDYTTTKSSGVTIPIANAVDALRKALPCLSRRQVRQFQNLSSKSSAKLFEAHAMRKTQLSKDRSVDQPENLTQESGTGAETEPVSPNSGSPTETSATQRFEKSPSASSKSELQ